MHGMDRKNDTKQSTEDENDKRTDHQEGNEQAILGNEWTIRERKNQYTQSKAQVERSKFGTP